MRVIEGIETVVASLKPHWPEIEQHFKQENEAYIRLIATAHGDIGRVLKCHLVVEHYLERYLAQHLPTIVEARLTFAQKSKLLPQVSSAAAFVRPGINLETLMRMVRTVFGIVAVGGLVSKAERG